MFPLNAALLGLIGGFGLSGPRRLCPSGFAGMWRHAVSDLRLLQQALRDRSRKP